ncbi:arf-GAP domain and FG repeat-containing protein 1-like isoform X3 [Mya arenaria]|uniref:arf-GAP domain and FG repeat-containing protein 1-like isoform X3 n=1 Tax=Mya arenaria TaxID=6604 RepID=UPI0022E2D1D6|nr:arf-GAP domain and FG repeat-containing protein 1-like isoform X3 [Mya arenaria]
MASNKKKQDEKHLKNLREMVALPHNKQCFDCHQRGPTYINMTIGAYVCTACSGLLRGLNPPHRVKSISMASFTPDEMEFLKTHGNEYCRKVWLGLYDNRLGSQSESRDESKVKDFMSQKYERKRYYVAPTESMKEEARQMNESAIPKTPGTRPLKSLLGNGAPKLVVGTQQAKAPVHPRATISATPPPISSTPQSPGGLSVQSSRSAGSSAMGDLLGDIGSDPFSSSSTPSQTPAGGGFADFGNFGNTSSSQPAAFSQSTPLQPFGNTPQTSQPAFNGFPPAASSSQPAGQPAPAAPLGGDKYSNLSDLFSVASTAESTSSSGWGSSLSSGGGVNWSSPASGSGGLNWGGDSTSSTSTGGGVSWNSQPSQPAASSSSGMSWGAANPFGGGSSTSLTTQGAQQTANPFGVTGPVSTGAGGGFGNFGTPGAPQQAGGTFGGFGAPATSTNAGFGQFGAQNGGFGATTSAGGFPGAQTGHPVAGGFPPAGQGTHAFGGQGFPQGQAGFGQQPHQPQGQAGFGQIPQVQAGFGQTPQGQGGFGGQGFGAPQHQQGFGTPQQGFGAPQSQQQGFSQMAGAGFGAQHGATQGWGQAPASSQANPFMSTAQQYSAPKTGATNPFL